MTETKEATAKDIADVLKDESMAVKELLTLVPPIALAKAWAAGEVEFGRRVFSITGPLGKPESRLVVESGVNWSGAKSSARKPLKELLAEDDSPPKCGEYSQYNLIPKNSELKSPLTKIEEKNAHDLIALQVRLTDKGLANIGIV